MPLAIFDIDGTLTDTHAVDSECFGDALMRSLELDELPPWERLDDVTDGTIVRAAWDAVRTGPFDPDIEERTRDILLELLRDELARAPERFRAMPGATEVFEILRARGWDVAMATGAWRASALLKLGAAGIPHADVPLATASEAVARQDIISRVAPPEVRSGRVVYLGDGLWDLHAARGLRLGFIGVGRGRRAARLGRAGDHAMLADFADPDRVLHLLERASPPR